MAQTVLLLHGLSNDVCVCTTGPSTQPLILETAAASRGHNHQSRTYLAVHIQSVARVCKQPKVWPAAKMRPGGGGGGQGTWGGRSSLVVLGLLLGPSGGAQAQDKRDQRGPQLGA